MARRSKPVLPGLSRSIACTKTKSCGRLDGHRKACRPTLSRIPTGYEVAPKVNGVPMVRRKARVATEGGVEVWSADRYTVPAEPKARKARKARRAVGLCRISRDGIRCSRPLGHKQAGKRHSFAGRVIVLPEGESKVSRTQLIGHAKRAKAAPASTRSRSNANALKGRV